MRYCPQCGAEYRPGFGACADCHVPLVDADPQQPQSPATRTELAYREQVPVFRTGRRIDAELARARLESCGFEARIWSSGLGVWHSASALTEVTSVPNAFGNHQVMVDRDSADAARELLDQGEMVATDDEEDEEGVRTSLSWLRPTWALTAFAILMLILILANGGI